VSGRRYGRLVAGVDSSTQSTKVLLCQADNGEVVAEGSAPHPPGTECHPHHWWTAAADDGRATQAQFRDNRVDTVRCTPWVCVSR